jgi:hypothetical protein
MVHTKSQLMANVVLNQMRPDNDECPLNKYTTIQATLFL